MPHSIATLAIIPLQTRLVYRVGKAHGYDLDTTHIKDFLATIGVGVTAQVVEGFVGRVAGRMARHVGGRFIGALAGQAAESGVAFASTYAIGEVARTYYGNGRRLSVADLQKTFRAMLDQGNSMRPQFAGQISQRARGLTPGNIMNFVQNA